MLPLLEKFSKAAEPLRGKRIRALILVPTRELAVEVNASVAQYARHTPLTSMAAYGGMDTAPQKERLIEGVDILVATPGRLLALASLPARRLQQVVGHARIVGVALVRRRSVHLGGHAALLQLLSVFFYPQEKNMRKFEGEFLFLRVSFEKKTF
mgnify:CR=1 FL=1